MEISSKLVFYTFFYILYRSVVRVSSQVCNVNPGNTSTPVSPCHNGGTCLETQEETGLSYLCLCDVGWHGNDCNDLIRQTETCGGVYSSKSGQLSSPMYPNNYTLRAECVYFIKIPNAKAIKLVFLDFSMENGRDTFEYGTGPTVDYRIKLGTYTGSVIPQPIVLQNNSVWILFSSDRSISDKGWKLDYTADFDNCVSNHPSSPVCRNDGNCTDGFQEFYCQCVPGYTGSQCETELSPEVGTALEDIALETTSVEPVFSALEEEIDVLKRVIVGLSLLSALVIGFLITALVLKRSHNNNKARFLPESTKSKQRGSISRFRRGSSKVRRNGPYAVARRSTDPRHDNRVIVEITPSQRSNDRPSEEMGEDNKTCVVADEI
ncbi:tolloid-like protein 2 [Glandiceps talaboti]